MFYPTPDLLCSHPHFLPWKTSPPSPQWPGQKCRCLIHTWFMPHIPESVHFHGGHVGMVTKILPAFFIEMVSYLSFLHESWTYLAVTSHGEDHMQSHSCSPKTFQAPGVLAPDLAPPAPQGAPPVCCTHSSHTAHAPPLTQVCSRHVVSSFLPGTCTGCC